MLIPPVGGVLIGHHLIVRRTRADFEGKLSLPAVGAWILGSVVGANFEFGIPALNSAVAALIVYTAVELLRQRKSTVLLNGRVVDQV